jgi:hypothetical protein
METREITAGSLWELADLLGEAAELARNMANQKAREEGRIFGPPVEEIGKIEMEVRMPNIPEEGP